MTTIDQDVWACPDAVDVMPAGVERADWLVARRSGIGGSDAATVAGLNPYSSRYELYLDKTGQLPEKEQTSAMAWGNRLEPVIAQWFCDTTGLQVRSAGLVAHRERGWQLGNVDRLVSDGGILEIKSTGDRQAKLWDDDQVPDAAELQSQHYLAVTGRTHAWVAVLVNGRDPLLRRLERDESLISTLTEMEREFWETYVLARVEPPIDDSEATEKALERRWPVDVTDDAAVDESVTDLLDEWERAKADEKAAKERARHAQSRIAALVGDAGHASVHGERVLSLVANGTFSAKRFTTENPELAETFTVTKPGIDTAALKSSHPDLYRQYCARVLRRTTSNGATDG